MQRALGHDRQHHSSEYVSTRPRSRCNLWVVATSLRTHNRVTELSTTLEIERSKNDGLVQTFKALSDKALRQNNQEFFRLASAKLEPLEKSLEQFDCKLQEVEKQRVGAYAGVTQQIHN